MKPAATDSLPDFIDGYGPVRRYSGRCEVPAVLAVPSRRIHPAGRTTGKVLRSIEAAFAACEVRDGATLSFHHHLRNGDGVLNMVLAEAARRGLRHLTVAASAIFPVHRPLVQHIRDGVVGQIFTAYLAGPVAEAISAGELTRPIVMQTHGGRAAAIESGRLKIDVAFIAAPAADEHGNLSGTLGAAACGPLGYAMVDAAHADRVVAVTDTLMPFPVCPIDIRQDEVDHVVVVDAIGDPTGILSGTTVPTQDAVGLKIAQDAAAVIAASGLLTDEFSFQAGAGGISLAVAAHLGRLMQERGIQGSFAAGGITSVLCTLLEQGLFRGIFDVQCFDLPSIRSYCENPNHMAMSASLYASPYSKGAMVNRLSAMVLGAAEIDLNFDTNVTTGSSGRILGGSGGHSDTADGAALAIVTTRLATRSGPKLVPQVRCVTTPGSTIDVLVTEAGIAVHPERVDLHERLRAAGLAVRSIEEMVEQAGRTASPRPTLRPTDRIVGVVEYRDGSVIDVVKRVEVPA